MAVPRVYNESSILSYFDSDLESSVSCFYPKGPKEEIKYHSWPNLEDGYFDTAGSAIHLYSDEERWAVVAEKIGYGNRSYCAEIELCYFGNCVNYESFEYSGSVHVSNTHSVILIDEEEFDRIENRSGSEMDQFEMISPDAEYVTIRDRKTLIEHNISKYRNLGLNSRSADSSSDLISFKDLLRYFYETDQKQVSATELELRYLIPQDIQKVMTIQDFHYTTMFSEDFNPKNEELYQLLAKILVTGDPGFWRPSLPPNNHWSKWESGLM